jgi:crossover junction endodeoxyribonuclease RuvC
MSQRTQSERVLAVDPGYDRIGFAVMEKSKLLFSECFVPAKGEFGERLHELYRHCTELICGYRPSALALETLFFSTNQKTAIRVAEARGVIVLAAAEAGIPLFEYSPQAVKIAVTGSGNAPKSGVIKMVERLVIFPNNPSTPLRARRHDDEYDAIALALAHLAQARPASGGAG